MSTQHTPGPLTPAMLRELKSFAITGEPTDPVEWHGANALWFHARDRVIGALDRRGLIAATPDWTITDAGRAAIAKATKSSEADGKGIAP